MELAALSPVAELAEGIWDRRIFPPSELDQAVIEYNAVHDAANRLFSDRCLPVGRFDLIYRDWYAASQLAMRIRRLSEFLKAERLRLVAEQRRALATGNRPLGARLPLA